MGLKPFEQALGELVHEYESFGLSKREVALELEKLAMDLDDEDDEPTPTPMHITALLGTMGRPIG